MSRNKLSLSLFVNKVNDIYVFFYHRTICNSLSFSFSIFNLFCNSPTVVTKPSNTLLWHKQLRHNSISKLNHLSIPGYKSHDGDVDSCMIRFKAKHHKLPFPTSLSQSQAIFDLIHVDVWGPYKYISHDGFKFFVTIVDDYSKHTWVHMITHKGYAMGVIKQFVVFVQTQFNKTIKVVRTDNSYELGCSNEGIEFYSKMGLLHQKSTPFTPQQNGIVERKHRHILEVA